MDYLEAAKARLAEIEGEHPAWQVDSLVRVAIADALVAIAEAARHALKLVPERTCKNIHAQKVTLDCFRCSECGAATGWTRIDIDNVLFPLRYCPNCGAKIEKESWWSE